jgi:hypothetical protein
MGNAQSIVSHSPLAVGLGRFPTTRTKIQLTRCRIQHEIEFRLAPLTSIELKPNLELKATNATDDCQT